MQRTDAAPDIPNGGGNRALLRDVGQRHPYLPEVGLTSHKSVTGVHRGTDEVERALRDAVESLGGMKFEIRWIEEVGDDGALYELLALIGPERERSAQIGWYLSRFRDGLVASTTAFNSEPLAREAIARRE